MYRNSFLFPLLDDTISKLISTGMAQKIFFNFGERKDFHEPPKEPKILMIEDLFFGFLIWKICCGISITIFLGEILNEKVFKEFLGLILLLMLIRKRIKKFN